MTPTSASQQPVEAVAASDGEHAVTVISEVLAAFRHEALNRIDFLGLHLSRAASALASNDARTAQESIAEMDAELQRLARSIDSLKVLRANTRRPANPLTQVWEHLAEALAGHARRAGAELQLRRDDRFDPLMPEPIVHALVTTVILGLNPVATHFRRRPLVVNAERSADDHVTLHILFPMPVERNEDTLLSIRLVNVLVEGCNGRSSTSGSDQIADLTIAFPIQEAPNG
jgi:hypothetical protein